MVWLDHIYNVNSDWNQHRVIGTNLDSVDGTIVQFGEINTPTLKTYLAFPTEITIKRHS